MTTEDRVEFVGSLVLKGRQKSGMKIPKPRTDPEFAVLGEYVFGVQGMKVSKLHEYFYELDTRHSILASALGLDIFDLGGYDIAGFFFRSVFGKLSTGGIGVTSYGSFICRTWRDKKRISFWVRSRVSGKPVAQGSTLRSSFQRLAAICRERREQSDS